MLLAFETNCLPEMIASVWRYETLKTFVNALLIVSVRMKVPLIIATPSTIARPVRMERSLRPSSP